MHITKTQHSMYSLEYYLDKTILKNTKISTNIKTNQLKKIIQKIIENKNCKITNQADINLIELEHITPGGGLITPQKLPEANFIGICSITNWTKKNPSDLDFIKLDKIITEIGIYTPENLELEINAFSSKV